MQTSFQCNKYTQNKKNNTKKHKTQTPNVHSIITRTSTHKQTNAPKQRKTKFYIHIQTNQTHNNIDTKHNQPSTQTHKTKTIHKNITNKHIMQTTINNNAMSKNKFKKTWQITIHINTKTNINQINTAKYLYKYQ